MISDNASAHSGDLIVIGYDRHLRGDHLQGAAPERAAHDAHRRAILT